MSPDSPLPSRVDPTPATAPNSPQSPTPETRTDIIPAAVSAVSPSVIAGLQIERLHAEGGMGRVWIARDDSLQRHIAFKDLRPSYAGDSHSRERFVREALVTGQLEHPGIVPVYRLGIKDEAGEPFYAMRFIQGHTLTEAIRDYHKNHVGDVVRFRELLSAFVAVCNAIAYAHSRGVLHRDLKPANIIVGEFGEVVVLDWGLAKLIGTPDMQSVSLGTLIATETQVGAIVGTPAYMAPEQALNEPVDARTDVYGLGAVLYEILTGRPPYVGDDLMMMLEQVVGGKATPPRQVNGALSPALDAICRQAMSARAERRYATAADVASDVRRWLADEPVSAYREPLTARVRRWGRKHRSLVTGLSALVLTATIALVVGLVVVEGQRHETQLALERVTEEEKKTSAALARVIEEEKKTSAALERSQKAEKSAAEQRKLALETVRGVVNQIDAKLKDKPAQQDLRKVLLREAQKGLQKVARAADTASLIDHETIVVHFELGDLFLNIDGATRQAKEQYARALTLATQVAQADSQTTSQHDLSISHVKLGDVQVRMGDSKSALASFIQAHKISERLSQTDPESAKAQRDLSVSYDRLGDVQLQLGDTKSALASFTQAHKISERLDLADPQSTLAQRDLSVSYNRLGDVQLQLGDSKSALASYSQSLKIRECLAQADPQSALAQRDLSICHERLGNLHLQLGDSKSALALHTQSLKIRERLAQADPQNADAHRSLSICHERLGKVYLEMGDTKAALSWYEKMHQARLRLVQLDPDSAQAQRDLLGSHMKLGDVQLQLGDSKSAFASYTQSLKIAERLAQADPQSAQAQRNLSVSYVKLGEVQLQLGASKSALASYTQSLKITERLVQADPQNAQGQHERFLINVRVGMVHEQQAEFAQAITRYRQALEIPQGLKNPAFLANESRYIQEQLAVCEQSDKVLQDPAMIKQTPAPLRVPVLTTVAPILVKQKKDVAKAVQAGELLAEYAAKGDDIYNAACVVSLCVPLSTKADEREKHAARAVALLKQAIDKGFKNVAQMKKDSDLDPLRGRDDFKKLLAEWEAKSTK